MKATALSCAAAATLAFVAVAAQSPAAGSRTIDGTPPSIGGKRLPIGYAAARARFGKPLRFGKVVVGCWRTRDVRFRGGLVLTFTDLAGHRVRPLSRRATANVATALTDRWPTPRGLRVGDSAGELKRLYPKARSLGGGYRRLESRTLGRGLRGVLQALVRKGRVAEISSLHGSC